MTVVCILNLMHASRTGKFNAYLYLRGPLFLLPLPPPSRLSEQNTAKSQPTLHLKHFTGRNKSRPFSTLTVRVPCKSDCSIEFESSLT